MVCLIVFGKINEGFICVFIELCKGGAIMYYLYIDVDDENENENEKIRMRRLYISYHEIINQ